MLCKRVQLQKQINTVNKEPGANVGRGENETDKMAVSDSVFVSLGKEQHGFIDLEMLPPELGITILSYLNATDLCLAGCVWQDLGNDEYLWQGWGVPPGIGHPAWANFSFSLCQACIFCVDPSGCASPRGDTAPSTTGIYLLASHTDDCTSN